MRYVVLFVLIQLYVSVFGIYTRKLIYDLDFMTVICLRAFIGGFVAIAVNKSYREFKSIKISSDLLIYIFLYIGTYYSSYCTTKYVVLQDFSFLSSISIMFLPLCTYLGLCKNVFRRKLDRVALIILFVGICIISNPKLAAFNYFYLLIILSSLFSAASSCYAKRLSESSISNLYNPLASILLGIGSFSFLLGKGQSIIIARNSDDLTYWAFSISIVIIGCITASTLSKNLSVSLNVGLSLLSPFISSVSGIFILCEGLKLNTMIGGIIITIGLYLLTKKRSVVLTTHTINTVN